MRGAAEADGVVDDGRRWWFVGADTWPTEHCYAAPNGRVALATYRRDLTEAERAGGRSVREVAAILRYANLQVTGGPMTTPEAYERDLGWALAAEVTRWKSDVAVTPVTSVTDCKPWLSDERIAAVRSAVLRRFVPATSPRLVRARLDHGRGSGGRGRRDAAGHGADSRPGMTP